MEDLLKRRFFYNSSVNYDGFIGPLGCGLKENILEIWGKFFILQEQMLKVEGSLFVPQPVL
jgi:glycyl-tRNA synthetase